MHACLDVCMYVLQLVWCRVVDDGVDSRGNGDVNVNVWCFWLIDMLVDVADNSDLVLDPPYWKVYCNVVIARYSVVVLVVVVVVVVVVVSIVVVVVVVVVTTTTTVVITTSYHAGSTGWQIVGAITWCFNQHTYYRGMICVVITEWCVVIINIPTIEVWCDVITVWWWCVIMMSIKICFIVLHHIRFHHFTSCITSYNTSHITSYNTSYHIKYHIV